MYRPARGNPCVPAPAWALRARPLVREPETPTMGKDRRKDKAEEDEALGKKGDKFGKKGDGKIQPGDASASKVREHTRCSHPHTQTSH